MPNCIYGCTTIHLRPEMCKTSEQGESSYLPLLLLRPGAGHFSLTNHLLPLLKTSAAASGRESRIVCLASMAHQHPNKGGIAFDRLDNNKGYGNPHQPRYVLSPARIRSYKSGPVSVCRYKPFLAYGQSKLADILFAKELARRLKVRPTTQLIPDIKSSTLLVFNVACRACVRFRCEGCGEHQRHRQRSVPGRHRNRFSPPPRPQPARQKYSPTAIARGGE